MDSYRALGPLAFLKRSGLSLRPNDGKIQPEMNYQVTTAAILVALAVSVAAEPTSQMEKPNPKVSCALSPQQLEKQRKKLLPGLFKRADKVTDLSDGTDGIRLHFKLRSGLLLELARIIEREQDCCSFLSFNVAIEPSGGPVTFDITGPAGTREMLKSL
jgi:hypothetical protein